MADLQFATPLMTVDNAALTQNVTIRGIGLKSGSPRASSGVAVYRDGVLVPPILNQTSFFDIGSVETLRGPQGTFAGSYSTGGAVYINSRDPDFNGVSGYVDTGARTYNGYGASGAVNVPFSETLAMRIALDGRTRDSYYDFINGGNGSPAPGGLQELGGRVGLLWQPSSDLRALFKVEGVRREAGGRDHRPRPGGIYAPLAPHDWRTLDFDTAQSTFERTARIALRLDYKVTNGVTLRSVTGGNDNYADNVDDLDGSAGVVPGAAGSEQHQLVSERTWSQELDLISSDDRPFSWVLGAYIFRTRIDVDIDQFTSPTTGRIPTVQIDMQNRKGNHGFFGHGRYNFTPALQAELGARWSHSFTEDTGAIDVLNVFGPGVNLVLANDGNHSDGVVTGKAGLNWTVNDRNYLFAFAAKGFSPGTANALRSDPLARIRRQSRRQSRVESGRAGDGDQLRNRLAFDAGEWRVAHADGRVLVGLHEFPDHQPQSENRSDRRVGQCRFRDALRLRGAGAAGGRRFPGGRQPGRHEEPDRQCGPWWTKAPGSCRAARRRCRNACRPPARRGPQGRADAGTTR